MAATSQIVDFSNVKDQGNFNTKRIPAGDYLATIVKIEDAKAKDETFQYLVSIKINKHSQTVLPYYCKLQENQLWKLRNLLIAAGMTVPKKRMKVDVNRLVNKVIGVTVEDDEYDGKEKSVISGVFPAADLADQVDIDDVDEDEEETEEDEDLDLNEGDDEADEAEDEADDEAEEEEEAGDEFDAMDRNELKAALKERDATFQARKSQTDDDLRTLLREAPAKKPAAKAKPAAKPATKPAAKAAPNKKPADLSDDDLDELDLDSL